MWAKEEGRPATMFWADVKGWGYKAILLMDNVHVNAEMESDLMGLMSSYFKNVGLKGASLGFETQKATIREEASGGDMTAVYIENSMQHISSNLIISADTPRWEIFGKALESMTSSAQFVGFMKDPAQERVVSDIMITADEDDKKVVLGIISGKANQIRIKALVSTLSRSKWGKVRAMAFKATDNYNNLISDERYYIDYEEGLEDLTDIIKSRVDDDDRKVLTMRIPEHKSKLMDAFKGLL